MLHALWVTHVMPKMWCPKSIKNLNVRDSAEATSAMCIATPVPDSTSAFIFSVWHQGKKRRSSRSCGTSVWMKPTFG